MADLLDVLDKGCGRNTVGIWGTEASVVNEIHRPWATHDEYDQCCAQEENPIVSTSVFLTERSRVVSSSDLLAPTMTAAVANGTAIIKRKLSTIFA